MQSKASETVFRPDIEGLRAIAILIVVALHARLPGFSGGFVGVDVFFVLSGYLITGLLVREIENTGTLDLARFYARRARRLLPAMTLMLLVTILAGIIIYSPGEQRGFTTTAAATAAYASNAYFISTGTQYGAGRADDNPLLHTWSLSVEEQFYLVWPVLMMFGLGVFSWQKRGPSGRRRLLILMLAVSAMSFALSYYLTGIRQPLAYFSSPTRAWEFALGAIAVLIPQNAVSSSFGRRLIQFFGWVGLAGIAITTNRFNTLMPFPGMAALIPVLSTIAVLRAASASKDNAIVRILSVGPFQEIGRLSYSWYLWHWPVLVLGAAVIAEPSLIVRCALVILALGLAATSYRLVENPIRHSRKLALRNSYSLSMAVALAVVGIGTASAWRVASSVWIKGSPAQVRVADARTDTPHTYDDKGCMAGYYDVKVSPCSFGPESASEVVVLIGDSHAAQWFPALESITSAHGWHLIAMTKSACGLVDTPYYYGGLGRTYNECSEWRKNALNEIQRIRPSLTIMASTAYYVLEDAEWRKGISNAVEKFSKSSQRVLILRDTPRAGFNIPTCLGRLEWRASFIPTPPCRFSLENAYGDRVYDYQKQAAALHQNVVAADVSSQLCPQGICEGKIGDMIVYRDEDHLTVTAIRSLEAPLEEQIKKAMAGLHHKTGDISQLEK